MFSSIRSYPEYYEVIERPMDLETVKQSLDSYSSVDQVLADMRLIWSNCKEFNAPGSDISATADTMAEAMEELVEVRVEGIVMIDLISFRFRRN